MNFKPKSEFTHNVLTLMTGTTIAQAIPIAISPILTRLYTPEDFGIFALYISVASIISVIATGRYELAIMLPKEDEDARNIVALSIVISFFVSVLALLVVAIFNTQITDLLGNSEIANWLYLIPISVFVTGMYQSFNYWNNRQKQYTRLASNRVVQSSVSALSNIPMGLMGFGFSGLIVSTIIGQGVSTFILTKLTLAKESDFFSTVKRIKMWALLKEYKKFPMINSLNALIDHFRLSGINILIAKFFTISVLGQFSLAWKIVQIPVSLIGSSLSQVFFQKISIADKSDLFTILKRFMLRSALISFPIFLFIYLFAVDVFSFVFGEEWMLSGQLASIMSPWLFFNFLSTPVSNIFVILNKQELVLKVSMLYMLIPLCILMFLNHLDFLYLVNLISTSMSCVLILFICLALFYTKKEKNNAIY